MDKKDEKEIHEFLEKRRKWKVARELFLELWKKMYLRYPIIILLIFIIDSDRVNLEKWLALMFHKIGL